MSRNNHKKLLNESNHKVILPQMCMSICTYKQYFCSTVLYFHINSFKRSVHLHLIMTHTRTHFYSQGWKHVITATERKGLSVTFRDISQTAYWFLKSLSELAMVLETFTDIQLSMTAYLLSVVHGGVSAHAVMANLIPRRLIFQNLVGSLIWLVFHGLLQS